MLNSGYVLGSGFLGTVFRSLVSSHRLLITYAGVLYTELTKLKLRQVSTPKQSWTSGLEKTNPAPGKFMAPERFSDFLFGHPTFSKILKEVKSALRFQRRTWRRANSRRRDFSCRRYFLKRHFGVFSDQSGVSGKTGVSDRPVRHMVKHLTEETYSPLQSQIRCASQLALLV